MVAPALIGAGIGTGLGILKYRENKRQDRQARKEAAVAAKFYPFLGIQPRVPGQTSLMGPLMQGALTGAAIGQGIPDLGFGDEAAGAGYEDINPPTLENEGGAMAFNAMEANGGPTHAALENSGIIDPRRDVFEPGLMGNNFDIDAARLPRGGTEMPNMYGPNVNEFMGVRGRAGEVGQNLLSPAQAADAAAERRMREELADANYPTRAFVNPYGFNPRVNY